MSVIDNKQDISVPLYFSRKLTTLEWSYSNNAKFAHM